MNMKRLIRILKGNHEKQIKKKPKKNYMKLKPSWRKLIVNVHCRGYFFDCGTLSKRKFAKLVDKHGKNHHEEEIEGT